jgi:hypothetical protein
MRRLFISFLLLNSFLVHAQVDTRPDSIIIKSKLRIRNHNEAAGKVLTSDASGNATWQSIPTSSNNWQVVGSNSARGGFNNNITDGTSNTILIGESNNQTSGQYLYGLGWGLEPRGFGFSALGAFNVIPTGSNTTWVSADPLFALGNGSTNLVRSNALLVLKDGRMGVNRSQTDLAANSQKLQVNGGAFIEGGLRLPTGAVNGRYLRSDASGNATWATLPSFSLSLPYADGISGVATAFSITNSDAGGFAFKTTGNIELKNINEKAGRILFSTDDNGNAKWGDGNCISKCSFSLTRNLKASIPSGSVQFLPFTLELFDVCTASNFVNISGDNDFHTFTAPMDGIYQFDFTGTFQYASNYALAIHLVDAANNPTTQLFSSLAIGSTTERSEKYTAIIKLTAGQKIAPTIIGSSPTGSIAFNNSDNSSAVRFSGHIIEATDCFTKN